MSLKCQTIHKKAFFLRHTACLPSNTSQLVWSGPCLGGGGPLPLLLLGGPLPPPHWGGSSSTTTSEGGSPLPLPLLVGGHLPPLLPGGSSSTTTSRGVLFHHHFGGVPCDLFHNALIYCYRTPQCIMGKIHIGPPQV